MSNDRCDSGGWAKCYPILDDRVRGLCHRPYPGHPRGCPNYGRRPTCPPQGPTLYDVFHRAADFWLVWNRFPLSEHIAAMHARHPGWTQRQLECCLYWQPRARRQLAAQVALAGHALAGQKGG